MSAAEIKRWLRDRKASNEANDIWPSENLVIDRLLCESPALDPIYNKLAQSLKPIQWQCVLGALLDTATCWNPDAVRVDRDAAATLDQTNNDIAEFARNLAVLIQRRERLSNHSGFTTTAEYHPVDFMDRAADLEGYGHYHGFLQRELHRLRGQYDLKYWPSLVTILQAIADDADAAEVEPSNTLTAAATAKRQASIGDFYRPFLGAVDELREGEPAWLPTDWNLTNAELAELGSYALNVDPNEPITEIQVKNIRNRR